MKERKRQRERRNEKEDKKEDEYRRTKREENHTLETNMLAGFMFALKSGCDFRRIFTIDEGEKREIFYTRANIS